MPPQSPTTEQEDHDMALAIQLQEEEDLRHRTEISRRQHEAELSQQYIEQQAQSQSQSIPVGQRRSSNTRGGLQAPRGGGAETRPAIPPRRSAAPVQPQRPQQADPEAGTDAPPPSYEQAANQAAYVPPANHPAHSSSSPNSAATTGRRTSYNTSNAQNFQGASPGGRGRGRGQTLIEQIPGRRATVAGQGGGQGQQVESRDRDCCVM